MSDLKNQIHVKVYDEAGEVGFQVIGEPSDVLIPLLAGLTRAEFDAVVADAEALLERRLMPSVRDQLRNIPPRGSLNL